MSKTADVIDSAQSDLADQIGKLRSQLDALMSGRVEPAMKQASAQFSSAARSAGKLAAEEVDVVSDHVRGRPITYVLAAAAVGYIIARLTR